MKKGFVLSLAVILGFTLVMGCTTMRTKDAMGKGASEMAEDVEITVKITIKGDSGEVFITDKDGKVVGEKLPLDQLEEIYKSPGGVKHISTILYYHRSPGCIVVTSLGTPFVWCPTL